MKLTITKPTEIEADAIRVELPVRYGEEDIPNDFPLRHGDMWTATIDIETGVIRGWPAGQGSTKVAMKVCDEGCYYLLSGDEVVGKREQDYVPGCIPGEYGDYVDFKIDPSGRIAGWGNFCTAKKIGAAFFRKED